LFSLLGFGVKAIPACWTEKRRRNPMMRLLNDVYLHGTAFSRFS
jgi:hypothetical protein